jgi:hypothetical protein
MPTQIDCINRALLKLGEEPIISLGVETKTERTVSAVYTTLLRAELQRNRWAFAVELASLALLADAPAWGFDKAYQLPGDCLSLIWVDGAGRDENAQSFIDVDSSPYRVMGRQIHTDLDAPLPIRYIAFLDNPDVWDAAFFEAFALRLAYEMCETLTQNPQKRGMLWSEYLGVVAQARRLAAIQEPPTGIPDGAWLQARL